METTIDGSGRLVVPREVRREAGLVAGMRLLVRYRAGRIEIEPAPLEVKTIRRGRLTVAVPQRAVPALPGETVERTRRRIRRERGSSE